MPDSVSSRPYRERLVFTKSALVIQGFVLLSVGLTSVFIRPILEFGLCLLLLVSGLVLLTFVRRLLKSGPVESSISIGLALANTVLFVSLLASMNQWGFPSWSVGVSGLAILCYVAACGRDFSFLGFIAVPSLTLLVLELFLVLARMSPPAGHLAWITVLTILTYTSYDLAMIMKRRTTSEVLTTFADFQRDLINLVTYPIRIYSHWRKYRFFITH